MEGTPNKLIARKLHVTEATVKVHVKAVLRKIGAANRTQAPCGRRGTCMADRVGSKVKAGTRSGRIGMRPVVSSHTNVGEPLVIVISPWMSAEATAASFCPAWLFRPYPTE
jgi:hypothetical protein